MQENNKFTSTTFDNRNSEEYEMKIIREVAKKKPKEFIIGKNGIIQASLFIGTRAPISFSQTKLVIPRKQLIQRGQIDRISEWEKPHIKRKSEGPLTFPNHPNIEIR